MITIREVPDMMKQAILAAEDERFYQHGGVDYLSVARAALANLASGSQQGAGTITMQVARNFFLTREKTVTRKLREVLLAWKIEANLSKDEILELYVNQIFLGPTRVRLRRRVADLLRTPAQGHHDRGSGDAGRPAQGAVRLQPRHQSQAGQDAPALRASPDARTAVHHGCPVQGSTKRAIERPAGRARLHPDPCRVRGGDGPAGRVRRVRRGRLHEGHHRVDHRPQGRPGVGLPRGSAGRHRLRPAPRLPGSRGLREPAGRPRRAGGGARPPVPGNGGQ